MYNYFNFNGTQINDLAIVTKIEKPYIPERTVNTLNITSRDGEVYDGMKFNTVKIPISLAIIGADEEDYNACVKILKDLFSIKYEVPVSFCDYVSIYGSVNSTFEVTQKNATSGYADIEIICTDPYSYSDYTLTYNKPDDGKTLSVSQRGTEPSYPMMTVGITKDTHFIQLENKKSGKRILVGAYPNLEVPNKQKETDLVFRDKCEALGNLTITGANIDANRSYNGTFGITVSGNSYKLATMGDGSTTYKGACGRLGVSTNLEEFKLTVKMYGNSAGKNGDPNYFDPDSEEHKEEIKDGEKITYYVVNCNGLNYRTGPGTNYTSKGTLPYGYEIREDYTIADGWCKFKYKTKTYYCSAKYLTKMTEDNTKSTYRTYFIENVMVLPDEGTKVGGKRAVYDSPGGKVVGYVPYGTIVRAYIRTYNTYDSNNNVKNSYYKLWKPYTDSKGNKIKGYMEKAVLIRSIDYSGQAVDYSDDPGYADDKTGTAEVYGFGVNGSQIFKLSLFDDNEYFEYSQPQVRIGSKVVLKSTKAEPIPIQRKVADQNKVVTRYYLSGQYGDWNHGHVYFTITRKKSKGSYVWDVTVYKEVDGKIVKTQKTTNIKGNDLPTENLSYMAIYIGTNATTMNKCAGYCINDIQLYRLNGKSETPVNVTYFKQGDIIDIDCENSNCYVNAELRNDLVDIGSSYFPIDPGNTPISLNSDDTNASLSVAVKEKWLGVVDDTIKQAQPKIISPKYPMLVEEYEIDD